MISPNIFKTTSIPPDTKENKNFSYAMELLLLLVLLLLLLLLFWLISLLLLLLLLLSLLLLLLIYFKLPNLQIIP